MVELSTFLFERNVMNNSHERFCLLQNEELSWLKMINVIAYLINTPVLKLHKLFMKIV